MELVHQSKTKAFFNKSPSYQKAFNAQHHIKETFIEFGQDLSNTSIYELATTDNYFVLAKAPDKYIPDGFLDPVSKIFYRKGRFSNKKAYPSIVKNRFNRIPKNKFFIQPYLLEADNLDKKKKLYDLDVPFEKSQIPMNILETTDKIAKILHENNYKDLKLVFIPKENSGLNNDRYCIKIYTTDPFFTNIRHIKKLIASQVDYFSKGLTLDFENI